MSSAASHHAAPDRRQASTSLELSAPAFIQLGQSQELLVRVTPGLSIRRVALQLQFDPTLLRISELSGAPSKTSTRSPDSSAFTVEPGPFSNVFLVRAELDDDTIATQDGVVIVIGLTALQPGTAVIDVLHAAMTDAEGNLLEFPALPSVEMHVESGPI